MQIDKNVNLVNVITGIFFMYSDVPISITSIHDKFHKLVYLEENVAFNEIYFTPGTAKFTEKEKEEDAGTIFEQELRFNFPGDDDDTAALLDSLRGRPLLIKILFANLKKKLIGLPENPARYIRSQSVTEKNSGHEITFICKAQESAWWIYYEGNVLPD